MKEKVNFKKQIFFVYLFSYLTIPFGILIKIFYSNNLNLEDFGLFYMIIGFFSLISIFNDFGFTETLNYYGMKFLIKKKYKYLKLTYLYSIIMQFLTGLIIVILILIFNNFLSQYWFHNENTKLILKILLIYFLSINIINPPLKLLLIKFDLFWNKIFKGLMLSLIFLFSYIFVNNFNGSLNNLIIISVIWTIITLILTIFYFILIKIKFKQEFSNNKFYFNKKLFNQLFKYAIPVVIGNVGNILLSSIDIQMIGILSNTINVGYYEITISIANILFLLISPISTFIFPLTTKLITEKKSKKLEKISSVIYSSFLFIIVPLSIILIQYSNFIFNLLFSIDKFYSNILFITLIISVIFSIFYIYNFQILAGIGLIKERNKLILFAGISNLILNFILFYFLGLNGIGISTMIVSFILFYFSYNIISKNIKIKIFKFKRILFNGIIYYFILKFLVNIIQIKYLYLKIFLIIFISISIYLLLSLLFGIIKLKEILKFYKKNEK